MEQYNRPTDFQQICTGPNELQFVDSSVERFSKLCAFCFVLLGSLFGNIFIIIIVYKNRHLRKTINYFIVNMAFSDLGLTLIVRPVEITRLVTDSGHWHVSGILGLICCKLFFFESFVSLFVSAQSLVSLISLVLLVNLRWHVMISYCSSTIQTVVCS